MVKRSCKHCFTEFEFNPAARGKPKEFCKPACSLAWRRAQKSTITAAPPIVVPAINLKTPANPAGAQPSAPRPGSKDWFKPRPRINKRPSPIFPSVDLTAYLPTQNDANIAAIIQGTPKDLLPYPTQNAVPLADLPPTARVTFTVDTSPPTF